MTEVGGSINLKYELLVGNVKLRSYIPGIGIAYIFITLYQAFL